MFLSPFPLYLVVLFSVGATATLLRFENGAYTDVIVAFDRGFVRNKEQIHNLETLIKAASRELYIATQGLAYFKQVRIINVTRQDEKPDDAENIIRRSIFYSRADIRIASSMVENGTPDAFTIHAGGCGEEGKFILLGDSLFSNLKPGNAIKLAARLLVQEWVRYRYGVFDELPTWGEQSFVWKGKEISPVTCVDGMQGWAMTQNHERCVLDCGRVRSNCRFFPDSKKNSGVESSLMSYLHLANVKHFCNSSNHNTNAPSNQNRMCNSKSIMEVIRKHKDFKDEHTETLNAMMEGPPEETVVIPQIDTNRIRQDIVFVVESSQMMEEANGSQEVQDFIQRFFVHLSPRRNYAAFVKFSDTNKILWSDVSVWNEDWQKDSILNVSAPVGSPNAIPDIDKALLQAFQMFKDGQMWFPRIILISTGKGKVDEVEQYHSWEKNRTATINSIVVGRDLNWELDRLSQLNGGESYFMGDARSRERREPRTFNLDMAFLASTHSIMDDFEQRIVISYDRFTLKSKGEHYDHFFRVDDRIGRNLVVTFSPNYIKYKLFNPRLDSPPQKTHQYGFGSMAKSILVDNAEAGRWTLELWQDSEQEEVHVDVLITATPNWDIPPGSWVWVNTWIVNVTEDKRGFGTTGCHRIYAEVKKGYSAIIDATVIATVQIPDQQDSINVTLRDNGGAPDVFKDDGIYSNFFPVTERQAGRPIVIVRVSNDEEEAWVKIAGCKKWTATYGMLDEDGYQRTTKRKFGDSKIQFTRGNFTMHARTKYYCKQRKEAKRICAMPLTLPFTRVTMTNSPILSPMSEDEVVKTPPAVIWDLEVVQEFKRRNGFSALLQWTSPEHPRPNMTVETIEVFGSIDQNLITSKKFSSANIIRTLKNIAPAGDVQRLEFNISKDMVTVNGKVHNMYFALKARDGNKTAGEMSNIAEAYFERFDEDEVDQDEDGFDQDDDGFDQDDDGADLDVDGVDQDVEEIDQDVQESNEETGTPTWVTWTVDGVVAVMGVVVIGAVGCVMWRKKRKATEASEEKES